MRSWSAVVLVTALAVFDLGAGARVDSPVLASPANKASHRKLTHRQPRLRRPAALAQSAEGRWLFVANRRSGSVSVIDTRPMLVRSEVDLGQALVDLVAVPGDDRLLALDETAHELLLLGRRGFRLRVLGRLATSRYPVTVRVDEEGRRAFVAALWSRRLDVFGLEGETGLRALGTVALPLAPRELLVLPGRDRLLVADAFGGRLAVVDPTRLTVEAMVELPAHNLRGLALAPRGESVLVSHQSVNLEAHTSRDDVLWGSLMANTITSLRIDPLLREEGAALRVERILDLGEFANPSGDPHRILVAGGEIFVSLAGVGKVAVARGAGLEAAGSGDWPRFDHVPVGRHPTALATRADGRLYVANTFSDSISVVDPKRRQVTHEISLGPQGALSDVDRGEILFYDANRSLLGWMSCHSCHTDGHANGALTDTLGDGSYGAPKRVPSLLGVSESAPWAWNGSMPNLAAQIEKSLRTTLRGPPPSEVELHALEAFLRSLRPPELPVADDAEVVRRGEEVFLRRSCQRCHPPPTYTSDRSRDVGLPDEVGNVRFNPPALVGVRHRDSFFHDGRAHSLREVFSVHHHPRGELPDGELDDLLAFLRTL